MSRWKNRVCPVNHGLSKKEHSAIEIEKDGLKFYINIYNINNNANGANSAAGGELAQTGNNSTQSGDDTNQNSTLAGDDLAQGNTGDVNQDEDVTVDKSKTIAEAEEGGTNVLVKDVDVDVV